MHVGLGLYRDSLTDDNLRFARQAGATHIVAHLVDYFGGRNPSLSRGGTDGWGTSIGTPLWSEEDLRDLVALVGRHGLKLAAIENLDPAHWHDVLLDGPARDRQLEDLKVLIRRVGRAGIPCIGYNFSLAGVWGWTRGPFARGGAQSVGFRLADCPVDEPIPAGMVWNMRYAPEHPGTVAPVDDDALWARLDTFLQAVLPVAEEEGVVLALHPDDPPADRLRGTARLVNRDHKYDRLLSLSPSPANRLELCLGSVQEMPDSDVYATVHRHAQAGRIGYIHFRNVRGQMPEYYETFVDEGDIDMPRIVRILAETGYDGVLIPDHTPEMTCAAPWHAGMAYALGYMRALIQTAGAT